MALKLYGFSDTTQALELMVRAHSLQQASIIFAEYIEQLNAHTVGALEVIKRIPTGTLTADGSFNSQGIINGNSGPSTETEFLALHLDRIDGSFAFTPDVAANRIISDITLISWVQFDSYQIGEQTAISKWAAAGNERAYSLETKGSSQTSQVDIKLRLTEDGTNEISPERGPISNLSNGEGVWIRWTWDNTTNLATAYESFDDKETDYTAISWTQIKAAVTIDFTGIFNSDADVQVGALDGVLVPAGVIGRAILIASTDPQAAAAVDFFPNRDAVAGDKTFTSSTTFELWTLQGNATIGPII